MTWQHLLLSSMDLEPLATDGMPTLLLVTSSKSVKPVRTGTDSCELSYDSQSS